MINVLRKYCSSFHKLTVKYCCKYFARDPLDFGKVNWQVLPPTHTSLPLLTNQLALQNQKHNTQTDIHINTSLSFGSNENGADGYLTIPNHKLNAPQVRVGLQMIGNRFNGG